MSYRTMTLCMALAGLAACTAQTTAAPGSRAIASQGDPSDDNRRLIFADEFDSGALDRSKWNVEGSDFWVNNEQQVYIDDEAVISFIDNAEGAEGGALVLQPVYRPGADTKAERGADFASGRLDTRSKFDFAHGRAEARIRMPADIGVWPAFWLLGNGKWPDTGEIDIMEYVGEKDWIGVALHGPGYSGETPLVNKYFFPEDTDVTDWHVYAVEWTADRIDFEVDGRLTYRVTKPMVENYGRWGFDNPKFLILNFALGGAYPFKTNRIEKPYNGVPQATVDRIKANKVAMQVDWVRVYAPDERSGG